MVGCPIALHLTANENDPVETRFLMGFVSFFFFLPC